MSPIEISHRPDGLLEKHTNSDCPEHLQKTFVGQHTYPTHKALFTFLENNLIGKKFETEEQVRNILRTWPEFARQNDLNLTNEFKDIGLKNGIIFCGESIGGPFIIGEVENK